MVTAVILYGNERRGVFSPIKELLQKKPTKLVLGGVMFPMCHHVS